MRDGVFALCQFVDVGMDCSRTSFIRFGLNALLLATVGYLLWALKESREQNMALATWIKSQPTVPQANAGVSSATRTNQVPIIFNWNSVESPDYSTYIRNLRSIGCPEETVRDIITADVSKLYDQKRAALRPKIRPKYWQSNFQLADLKNRELERQLRALDAEEQRILKELLGVDGLARSAFDSLPAEEEEDNYGPLPPEKRRQMREWSQKYLDLELELQSRAVGGILSSADEIALQKLQKERQEELARILNPQELLEYELRTSPQAQVLRDRLVGTDVTEEEFRSIFQWQKAMENQSGDLSSSPSPDAQAKLAENQKQLGDQIRNLLGEKRYGEFQRGQDPGFQDLRQLAQRYNLPQEAANSVYDLQQALADQQGRILADPSLTRQQRAASLAQLKMQTDEAVRNLIGAEAFDIYQRRFGRGGN